MLYLRHMKKRILLVANWKTIVKTEEDALNLFNSIKNVLVRNSTTEMIVCPPSIYLNQIGKEVISDHYNLGAQDAYPDDIGNRTGEVTMSMIKDAGAKYVILGNSERSHLEDRHDIAYKVTAALENEIQPIICVGEKQRDKDWKKELIAQVRESFYRVSKKNPENIVIVYEPEWAIYSDKKNPATSVQYNEAMEVIKKELHKLFKTLKAVESIKFLYGGSLDDKNIEDYLKNTNVDGFMVGRVAHDPRILMTMFRLISEGLDLRAKALKELENE